MKHTKKILSVLLVCAMLIGLIPLTGLVGAAEEEKRYDRVIFFGDSTSRGRELNDTTLFDSNDAHGVASGGYYAYTGYSIHGQENSFPDLVADALVNKVEVTEPALKAVRDGYSGSATDGEYRALVENSNRFVVAWQGETLSSVMALFDLAEEEDDPLLDPSVCGFARNYWPKMQYFFADSMDDGITYTATGNTSGYYPISSLIRGDAFEGTSTVSQYAENDLRTAGQTIANPAVEAVAQEKTLIVLQLGLSDLLYRPGNIAGSDTEKLSLTLKAYDYIKESYPKLLDKIRELNPAADIVMVGPYNMFLDAPLSERFPVKIGTALSILTSSLNTYLASLAKKYGCAYADISNAECPITEEDVALDSDEYNSNTEGYQHPSVAYGLPYIARQVIAAAESIYTAPVKSTDIVVDLARFGKDDVTSVLVNGIPRLNYSIEDTILTVPYLSHHAVTMTVNTKVNGKRGQQKYQLVFKHGSYTAYKISGTNSYLDSFIRWKNSIFE